jgi:hypothetical protein
MGECWRSIQGLFKCVFRVLKKVAYSVRGAYYERM